MAKPQRDWSEEEEKMCREISAIDFFSANGLMTGHGKKCGGARRQRTEIQRRIGNNVSKYGWPCDKG